MQTFKFIHAADLHLDSPLVGLRDRAGDMGERLARASKLALDNLIDLAIDEQCRFMVLAGDIFDGDIRNFQSALHFAKQMRRLKDANIDVFIVLGNHDAENKFMSRLEFSEHVHIFASKAPQTLVLDDIAVALHGQSFPKRDVTDNIARSYPAALQGHFNIGVLHTACTGRAEHHAPYAPCSVEQLVNHGYAYWALGHVHKHQILNRDPWVVYPGNLQGRSAKEIGAKGAIVVEVQSGSVRSVEHRALDVLRWEHAEIDVGDALSIGDVVSTVRAAIEAAAFPTDRLVALRIRLFGATAAHSDLRARTVSFSDDLEAMLASLGAEVWLEKLVVQTETPQAVAAIDPSIAGRLARAVTELQNDPWYQTLLEQRLAEIRAKMPASVRPDETLAELKPDAGARAAAVALSLIEAAPEASDEAA